MKAEAMEVAVRLTNEKVQFAGRSRSNPEIVMDYFPPLGDGHGYTGLELLLMSLAACSGTSVVYLLRKMGKKVEDLNIHAKGIRKDAHPTSFRQIYLEFAVTSGDVQDQDIKKAINLSEESLCPVWAMLKNNVEIITGHKIILS